MHHLKALGAVIVVALTLAVNAGTALATTANFHSTKYPATITSGNGFEHINLGPGFCFVNLTGELTETANSISMTPKYGPCAIGEKNATVATEGCTFTFFAGVLGVNESEGSRQIVCPSGKEIKTTAGECVIKIPPTPEPVGTFHYKNQGEGSKASINVTFEGPLSYWENSKCGGSEGMQNGSMIALYTFNNINGVFVGT